jgi:hypothetical protein
LAGLFGPPGLICDPGWYTADLGSPRTAAMSACRCGAAAAAVPNTIVARVLPPAVMLTVWHPLAP